MNTILKKFVLGTAFSICGIMFADFYCERCGIEHKGNKCPLETILGDINSLNDKQVQTLLGALGKRGRELMNSDEIDSLTQKIASIDLDDVPTPLNSPMPSEKEIINAKPTTPTFSLVYDKNTFKPILLVNGKKDSRVTGRPTNTIDDDSDFFFDFREKSTCTTITYTPAIIYIKDHTDKITVDEKEKVLRINGETVQGFSMDEVLNNNKFYKFSARPSRSKNEAKLNQIELSLLFKAGGDPILLINGKPSDFILKNKIRYSLGSAYTFENLHIGTIVFWPPTIEFSNSKLSVLDGKPIQGFSANHVGKFYMYSGSNANQPNCTFEFGGAVMVDPQTLPQNKYVEKPFPSRESSMKIKDDDRVKVRAKRRY